MPYAFDGGGYFAEGVRRRQALANVDPQTEFGMRAKDGAGRWRFGNVVDNFATGLRQGMLLDNLLFSDPEVQASDDLPVVRILGLLGGAIGEGAITQSWMLRGLEAVAKTSAIPRVAAAAKTALEGYLIGDDIDLARKLAGHTALGVANEVALNVLGGRSPQDVASAAGVAALTGGLIGAASYGLTARRALGSLDEAARADAISKGVEGVRSAVNDLVRYEHAMRKYTSLWRPGGASVEGIDYSDDWRHLVIDKVRNSHEAERAIETEVAQHLRAAPDPKTAWASFQEIVQKSTELGRALTHGGNATQLKDGLDALRGRATPEVQRALAGHLKLLQPIADHARERLAGVGALNQFDAFAASVGDDALASFYYAAQLADMDALMSAGKRYHVQMLRRGSFVARKGGDTPAGYLETMHRALSRTMQDAVTGDFVDRSVAQFGVKLSPEEAREAMSAAGHVKLARDVTLAGGDVLPAGTEVVAFNRRPGDIYPTFAVNDAAAQLLNDPKALRSGTHLPPGLVGADEAWAIATPRADFLPRDIAERLTREITGRSDAIASQAAAGSIGHRALGALNRATAAWKYNTLWWGLMKHASVQVVGDAISGLRSNPALFLQRRGGRFDSPAVRALGEIFKAHGVELGSSRQATEAALGAAIGAGANELTRHNDTSWPERAAAALAGAGLGYAHATFGLARAPGTIEPALARLHARSAVYDLAEREGVLGSGSFVQESELARRLGGAPYTELTTGVAQTPARRVRDTALTLLSGRVHGAPAQATESFVSGVQTAMEERENWLRLASFMQQLEDGTDVRLAAKRSREAFVDYGRFTDFEDRYLRGALLPFYAFTRANTANWAKTLAGADVGGKAGVALAATGALAAFDVASQAWNRQFFGDTEDSLEQWRRDQWHLILGNPLTGEVYRDKRGRPMVVSSELGYEPTLDLLGLARPHEVLNLFGAGIPAEQSSLERTLLVDDVTNAPLHVRETLGAFGDQFLRLLTPALKVPWELHGNESTMYHAPIVPEQYRGTPEQWKFVLAHAAGEAMRQYREADRFSRDLDRGTWSPISSAIGLGLPVEGVDTDGAIRRHLHDLMDRAAKAERSADARWRAPIDDIVYSRVQWNEPRPDEEARLGEVLARETQTPKDREQAVRYYVERSAKSSVERHWNTLSAQERARFVQKLSAGDLAAFTFYANGGDRIQEYAQMRFAAGR